MVGRALLVVGGAFWGGATWAEPQYLRGCSTVGGALLVVGGATQRFRYFISL